MQTIALDQPGWLARLSRRVVAGVLCLVVSSGFTSAQVQVRAPDGGDAALLQISVDAPVGDILQTYLSPDAQQLAIVLSGQADLTAWQGIADRLVAADSLIMAASTEGLRGGSGIVLELARPVSLDDERLSVIDATTARWVVELGPAATRDDVPAALDSDSGPALAGIEARQRGAVTEVTLLGRRNLLAEVMFEPGTDRVLLIFPGGQQLGLEAALPEDWPQALGDPSIGRSPNGGRVLIFEGEGPLDLVGATSELDATRLVSRTRLLFGRDQAPDAAELPAPDTIALLDGEGLSFRVTGDPQMRVQPFLLADPARLIVDLLGVAPGNAESLVDELAGTADPQTVRAVELGRTRLGSARIRIDLARDYAQGLALDTVPFVSTGMSGEIDIALPEPARYFENFAGSAQPITLETQGLRLTLPEGFADETAPSLGLGSTQLLDEFYGDSEDVDAVGAGEQFSLRRALADALARDPQYQAALASARAEREALPQALAGYRPSVSLVGRGSYSEQDVRESGTITPGETSVAAYSYALEVAQPILRGAALREIQQARVALEQAEAAERAARQDLILRLAQAYLQVLQALDESELARAEREALAAQLELAEQRFERGLGNRNELNDARSGLAIARAREIQRRNELDDARLALKEIVGAEVAGLEGFRADFTPSLPFPDQPAPWITAAEAQNPELRTRLLANRIAQLEVDRQRATRLPTLDLTASAGRQSDDQTLFSEDRQEIDTAQVALELRMPLYSGGRTSSLIREAQARLTESVQQAEGERRRVERAVRSSFLGVVSTAELMDALKASLEAEEVRLQTRIEGLESGVDSQIEVLEAYQQYFAVRRDYAEVRLDYLVNRLSLQQAVGTLDERDLGELDRLLDTY